jgi:hypothetical protein
LKSLNFQSSLLPGGSKITSRSSAKVHSKKGIAKHSVDLKSASSARDKARNLESQQKNIEVVSYRRETMYKKRKRQPKLNNMKQMYINSPSHANVNLDSNTTSPDNSRDFVSSKCLASRSEAKNLKKIEIVKCNDMEINPQPRNSNCVHYKNNPFLR